MKLKFLPLACAFVASSMFATTAMADMNTPTTPTSAMYQSAPPTVTGQVVGGFVSFKDDSGSIKNYMFEGSLGAVISRIQGADISVGAELALNFPITKHIETETSSQQFRISSNSFGGYVAAKIPTTTDFSTVMKFTYSIAGYKADVHGNTQGIYSNAKYFATMPVVSGELGAVIGKHFTVGIKYMYVFSGNFKKSSGSNEVTEAYLYPEEFELGLKGFGAYLGYTF